MASRTVPQAQAETTASRMDALVLAGPGQFVVQQVDVPQPGRMELLCRVEAASICGTDQHIIEGHTRGRWPRSYPFIPGHEWAGTVAALGEGAELLGWKVDDRVAGTSHAGCGYCRMCRTGRYNLCENYGNLALHRQYGHYVNGAFAQYVVHSVKSVFPLAEALSFEEGAIVDTASIALWTVKRGKINAGDTVVILGPGAMGLLVAQCAAALGAGRVIVVGHGQRLNKARDLGFLVVDFDEGDPVQQVKELSEGKGAHLSLECAGTALAIRQAVEMVRKGGRVVFNGLPLESVELPMQKIVLEEIDLYGVRANQNTMEEVIPLMLRGAVSARSVITHVLPLRQFREAYDIFVARREGALKVVVKPQMGG